MPKKTGAQPNNKNAFKHGFYSEYSSPFENKALSEIPATDLNGEIDLLRTNIDRFMEAYTKSLEDLDYENRLAALRAITVAVGRIASLERIQTFGARNTAEVEKTMNLILNPEKRKPILE